MNHGVAIIGCGLIGQKRAAALSSAKLIACADKVPERAKALAAKSNSAKAFTDWYDAIREPGVSIVVVSTLHDSLAEITRSAIEVGCHVLVEKPAARRVSEIEDLKSAAARKKVKLRVGFNHRYHRAFRMAREIVDSGQIGDLMFVRARYGHGGRPGYDREWRAIPELSGGGELIDQGSHIIDLSRWFLGDFTEVSGAAHTYFWDMKVDDNAFLLLKTKTQQTAFLHASCTEWKNLFSFEIYGRVGKLEIAGLGGSYGVERLTLYKMLPEMGPPETTSWEFPMVDDSWQKEFEEFLEDIRLDRDPNPGISDAVANLKIIEKIYLESGYDYRA